MSHPPKRSCWIDGVSEDDHCPKWAILLQLKKKLDDIETYRPKQQTVPRLHVVSETCNCFKTQNPNVGKKKYTFPLQTVNGAVAHPDVQFVYPSIKWTPPVPSMAKDPHKYLSCFGGQTSAPSRRRCCKNDCFMVDEEFGLHLDKDGERDKECCYIECEHEKPDFRQWRPIHVCHYPGVCKASCFEHPTVNDYYNLQSHIHRDSDVHICCLH
ncbi:hypothetical protein O3M35_010859 [Rhynocoris fuscipes]|uniref:Uncharacterized protein n=1 Tax=Rhynocoris fuscipes TaxID=488301 RepID=A0AAW1D0M5_9HEMI